MSATATHNDTGTTLTIGFSFYNPTAFTISDFEVGMMTVDPSGNKTYSFRSSKYKLESNRGYPNSSYSMKVPDDSPDGVYTIYPVWKSSDGNIEQIRYSVNCAGYVRYTKNGTEVTVGVQDVASVTVSDLRLESDLYLGSDFKCGAKLTNTSNDSEYAGTLAIGLYDDSDNLVAIGNDSRVIISAGGAIDWPYISPVKNPKDGSTPAAGTYNLYVLEKSDDDSYKRISDPISVTLHDAAKATLRIDDLTVANDQIFWMMEATGTVKCTEGYFAGTLPIYIFPNGGDRSLASFASEYFSVVAANATSSREKAAAQGEISVTWKMPFYAGATDTEYFACVYHGGSQISNYSDFRTSLNTGVENIESDHAEVVETEYFTLTGISLGKQKPGHGIYIIRQTHSDGSVTTGRIAL